MHDQALADVVALRRSGRLCPAAQHQPTLLRRVNPASGDCLLGRETPSRQVELTPYVTEPPVSDPTECEFVNGSFEEATANPGAGAYLATGSTTLVGWSVVEGSVHYSEDFWQYADGRRGLDLNGGSPGGVEQALATVPGRGYVVRFALSGNPDRTTSGAEASPTVKGVQVYAGDRSQTFTFDVTGRDNQNMGWVEHEFTFNATSTSSELRFRSITYSAYWGPAVENVRVYGCAP